MTDPRDHAPDGVSTPTHERTALKEWAVLCDALAAGDVVAMVRKGGIREQRAGFAVRHARFLLYPTFFHEKAAELQPRFVERLPAAHARRPADGEIRIELVAEAAAVWTVRELDRLRVIEREHGMAWPAVEARFHYKGRPEIRVVAVRAHRLARAATLPETRRYQGCVSWVALDAPVDVTGAVPVVDERAFAERMAALHAALGPADARD